MKQQVITTTTYAIGADLSAYFPPVKPIAPSVSDAIDRMASKTKSAERLEALRKDAQRRLMFAEYSATCIRQLGRISGGSEFETAAAVSQINADELMSDLAEHREDGVCPYC